MAYFFIEALISIVIGNAKIFIVVPACLQLVHWAITNSQMQVKCLTFSRVYTDRQIMNIVIDSFDSDIQFLNAP